MRVLSIALVIGIASSAAQAQVDKFITSPPGFLTTEAGELTPAISSTNRNSRFFGAYQSAEFQIFDDHLRDGNLRFLKQMDYRSDTRGHGATNSMGRTWTSVTVSLSNGDFNGPLSKTFSLNTTSTPTTVFNSSMNWPTVTQNKYPSPQPNDWGVISIPFSSQFVSTGTDTVLHHFKFSGGTLANNGAWTGTTAATYKLDAHFNDVANTGYYYTSGAGCVDSHFGGGSNSQAYAYVYTQTYSSNTQLVGAERAGKIWVDVTSNRTAPMQPVMMALSLGGANVPMPMVSCKDEAGNTMTQPLRVDLALGVVLGGIARYNGQYNMDIAVPYNASFVGQRLYMQNGWADSVTGDLSLSRRAFDQFAKQPDGKFLCLYTNGSVTGTAASITAWMDRIPLVRYTYQ